MQLASKMRFLAAQFIALLGTDLWRRNAEHANRMARLLAERVRDVPGITHHPAGRGQRGVRPGPTRPYSCAAGAGVLLRLESGDVGGPLDDGLGHDGGGCGTVRRGGAGDRPMRPALRCGSAARWLAWSGGRGGTRRTSWRRTRPAVIRALRSRHASRRLRRRYALLQGPRLARWAAFWRSLLLPGWGQAKLNRKLTGALFVAWEGVTLGMSIKTSHELSYLRRTQVGQREGQGEGAAGLAGAAGLQPPLLGHRGLRLRPSLGLPRGPRNPRRPHAGRRHRRRASSLPFRIP